MSENQKSDPPLLTMRDLTIRLGVPRHRLVYACEKYHISPKLKAGAVHLYGVEQIAEIQSALKRTAEHAAGVR